MIPEEIKMLKDASDFTAFNEKLALLIEPHLNNQWDMADFGCGLALLDFKIAPHLKSITAIDNNEEIISEVEKTIDYELLKGNVDAGKIQTLFADTRDLASDMTWDIVMLNFYNIPFEELAILIGKARERAIIIVDGKSGNTKFLSESLNRNHYSAPELEEFFTKQGYNYKKNIIEMQFGYPFKNMQDIQAFLQKLRVDESNISKNGDSTGIASNIDVNSDFDKLVASLEERIIRTNRYDYPYYLPKNVSIGIFVISK